MIFQVPIVAIPNQLLSTSINGTMWTIGLYTRKDHLYMSLSTSEKNIILNRVCRDRTEIAEGFLFVDLDGYDDPTFETLNSRHMLVWTDEEIKSFSTGFADPTDPSIFSYAPFNLTAWENIVSWETRGQYDYINYYRSSSPINTSNPPLPIAQTTESFYRDEDLIRGNDYYIVVSTVLNGVEKFSEVLFYNYFSYELIAYATTTQIIGHATDTAKIEAEVDTSLSANMLYSGLRIVGKAEPNATITIEVED